MAFDWNDIQKNIQSRLSHQNFFTWIKPVGFKLIDNASDTIVLTVPDKFTFNWIIDKYQDVITEEIFNSAGKYFNLKFEIINNEKNNVSERKNYPLFPEKGSNFLVQTINPKYSFDEFIVGNCNEFARAASLAVSEQPGKIYNPLFIYGGTGLGKTHLLCAIGLAIIKFFPETKVCYINSEKFMNELITAIRRDKTDSFRKKFREQADVFLIDDIQFIAGKERTQEEFFFTFNELYQNKKQIVITSDKSPRDIKNFEERLVSRFEWGLNADIQPPDIETRIAIIRNKASNINLNLNDDVVMFLAQNIKSNIREIEGSVNRIHAYSSLSNLDISTSLIKRILPDLCHSNNLNLTTSDIIKCVCSFYNIKTSDLLSNRRLKTLTGPRHIAMYLARKLTRASFPEIGKTFGGRDHTTIMHAFEKISKQLDINPDMQNIISRIENNLII